MLGARRVLLHALTAAPPMRQHHRRCYQPQLLALTGGGGGGGGDRGHRGRRGLAAAAAAGGGGGGGGSSSDVQQQQRSPLARSVRAMPIKLVSVAKGNSRAAAAMADEWVEKLRRYAAVTEVQLKPNPKGASSPAAAKEHEAERVLKAIAPGDRVVLLDERGREVTSEDVARIVARAGDDGAPLVFVVGGPFGHGRAAAARADDTIRLSRCVLNHQVAYVVLCEQLYRAWTILRGEPYHH